MNSVQSLFRLVSHFLLCLDVVCIAPDIFGDTLHFLVFSHRPSVAGHSACDLLHDSLIDFDSDASTVYFEANPPPEFPETIDSGTLDVSVVYRLRLDESLLLTFCVAFAPQLSDFPAVVLFRFSSSLRVQEAVAACVE
jgi:hypothetical protein